MSCFLLKIFIVYPMQNTRIDLPLKLGYPIINYRKVGIKIRIKQRGGGKGYGLELGDFHRHQLHMFLIDTSRVISRALPRP